MVKKQSTSRSEEMGAFENEYTGKRTTSGRITTLVLSVIFAIPLFFIAKWLEPSQGLMVFVYWLFSVWTIWVLLYGLNTFLVGQKVDETKMFWFAFFINIPIQIWIANQ